MARKSSVYDYEACVHELQLDKPNRELYLVGEEEGAVEADDAEPGVEFLMASRIIRNLRILTLAGGGPILIHMKTDGGYVKEGYAIYDAIRTCPCYVTILNYAPATSMSSIILQAADYRVMMPSSYFMFHRGTVSVDGTTPTVQIFAEFCRHDADRMLNIYAQRMQGTDGGRVGKWTIARIEKWLTDEMDKKTDVYLTAEEAVAWGLADAVFDGDWGRLK